jgi:hypothetical protein
MANEPKRKPLGRALPDTDADLDRRAEVTTDDETAAFAEATPETRALVEAATDEGPTA